MSRAKKWPRLDKALEHCRRDGAILVISALGRLVRNPKFIARLIDSEVEFACLDNQHCNKHTARIHLAMAEEVSERISLRTRRTLAAAVKAKGIKLGSNRPGHWEGREHKRRDKKMIAESIRVRKIRVRQTYEFLLPTLKAMRLEGKTMEEIATWLNDRGHKTTVGGLFTQTAVWRLLKRYLGDDFLGHAKDRGGRPLTIRAMEKVGHATLGTLQCALSFGLRRRRPHGSGLGPPASRCRRSRW